MAPYKLLAIDIDGTLITQDNRVPERNVVALREAHAAGVHIVLVTGRMLPNVEAIVDQLDLDPYIAGYNGAKIVAPRAQGRVELSHSPVPAVPAWEILHGAHGCGWLVNFYHEDRLYGSNLGTHHELLAAYLARGGFKHEQVEVETLQGLEPTKLVIIANPELHTQIFTRLEQPFAQLHVVQTEREFIEVMARGVHKATALMHLAERLGVTLSECVAVGDSGNDLEMLRVAGLGVAVANARADIAAAADVCLEQSAAQGAVAELVYRYLLPR